MKNEFEKYDLATLLSMYTEESRAFSTALSRGASWQELREMRARIRKINECINAKNIQNGQEERRRDNLPPESSGE